ncbi:MAG: divalent-cation tolerance protein CutA [Pyrinomonadaceae bacterium]|nr:divalent-cation tolerance protein CutA [Pyrinomonadaceae bacterium]
MYIVFTTVSDLAEGESLAEKIVTEKVAACVQILPKMTSVYVWKGELKNEPEHLLLIKTLENNYDELEELIKENHSYDVPEIIAVESEEVADGYFKWMSSRL